MRTTLNLDPLVLAAARKLAQARAMALGDVISELAARGLQAQAQADMGSTGGFPVFSVTPGAQPIGLDDVKRDEDADGGE